VLFWTQAAAAWSAACLPSAGLHGTARQVLTDVTTARQEPELIILGIVLLIIGFIAKIAIVWTIGIIALVIGLILLVLGMVGHAVGGRKHYF
jgi:hypothetical protein